MGRYNHWTGLLDWTGLLSYFHPTSPAQSQCLTLFAVWAMPDVQRRAIKPAHISIRSRQSPPTSCINNIIYASIKWSFAGQTSSRLHYLLLEMKSLHAYEPRLATVSKILSIYYKTYTIRAEQRLRASLFSSNEE